MNSKFLPTPSGTIFGQAHDWGKQPSTVQVLREDQVLNCVVLTRNRNYLVCQIEGSDKQTISKHGDYHVTNWETIDPLGDYRATTREELNQKVLNEEIVPVTVRLRNDPRTHNVHWFSYEGVKIIMEEKHGSTPFSVGEFQVLLWESESADDAELARYRKGVSKAEEVKGTFTTQEELDRQILIYDMYPHSIRVHEGDGPLTVFVVTKLEYTTIHAGQEFKITCRTGTYKVLAWKPITPEQRLAYIQSKVEALKDKAEVVQFEAHNTLRTGPIPKITKVPTLPLDFITKLEEGSLPQMVWSNAYQGEFKVLCYDLQDYSVTCYEGGTQEEEEEAPQFTLPMGAFTVTEWEMKEWEGEKEIITPAAGESVKDTVNRVLRDTVCANTGLDLEAPKFAPQQPEGPTSKEVYHKMLLRGLQPAKVWIFNVQGRIETEYPVHSFDLKAVRIKNDVWDFVVPYGHFAVLHWEQNDDRGVKMIQDMFRTEEARAKAEAVTKDMQADPFSYQVGGNHYTDMKIQPAVYNLENDIGWAEGNIIAYLSRWKSKEGIKDLKKARQMLDMLIYHYENSEVSDDEAIARQEQGEPEIDRAAFMRD